MNAPKFHFIVPSPPGITQGLYAITAALQDYRDRVWKIFIVEDRGRVATLAVFRPHGTPKGIDASSCPISIDPVSVILNEWGGAWGYNGEGHKGYFRLRSCIDDFQLNYELYQFEDLPETVRSQVLGGYALFSKWKRLFSPSKLSDRLEGWESFLQSELFEEDFDPEQFQMPIELVYPINKYWGDRMANYKPGQKAPPQ